MKQRNSLTSNNKQTGRRPADMLDIYKLIYLIWPVWSLQQDWKISNEGPFFRFSWDRQKLLVTLPRWRSLCHSLARDQPQPGSFFQRPREAEKRDPGNEVASKVAKGMTSSLWRHTFNIYWHFIWKNNWQLVFFLFTKFGVERVNTFGVMRNNKKYPRNRETFVGWFGPYVCLHLPDAHECSPHTWCSTPTQVS